MGLEYMGEYYRNYAQVNLNHIRNNLELVRATIKKGCKLMVVLKANAYGHGIEQCAIACRNADMFAVATLQEALMIRRTGLRTPVLLLGPVDPNEINTVCQNEFTLTISSVSYAEQIQRECERSGQSVLCHVKVDTGLNRTGIRCRTFSVENACEEAGRIFKMPSLKIEGVYTHFACAGSENLDDQAFTQTQYSTFVSFCERMEHLGFSLGLRHCCSTSAFLTHPEMELDMVGDQRTALFIIISDTDDTFNFIVSIMYTQLFNLLCDRADDVYGGRLPIHVRCLLDEFANIGQIPKFEKLIATIRSREISASIILQSKSQLKAIYKDNADTIEGNCDTTLFLGGKEKTTLKEIAEILGKETIDLYNTSDTRGSQRSYGMNYQKTGKELMSQDEIAVMDGGKCILQVRGVRPFFSNKYDICKHKNYKYLSDYDKKNTFDIEKYLSTNLILKPEDEVELYQM